MGIGGLPGGPGGGVDRQHHGDGEAVGIGSLAALCEEFPGGEAFCPDGVFRAIGHGLSGIGVRLCGEEADFGVFQVHLDGLDGHFPGDGEG